MKSIRYYRWAADLVQRRITAFTRALPDVFILGATKAGSSTLAYMLWQHPEHVRPLAKELMYLQQLPVFRSNWESTRVSSFLWGRYRDGHARYSVSGYRKFFPTAREMRRLSKTGKPITSDCDPFNLYCDTAMRRIAKLARRPRFIVSLRDPIRRAFSDFNMHRTNGERDARSFAQAIDDELSGVEKRFRKRFIHQSVYAPHVERLLATFPRDQLLIIKAEDLFSDPALIARQLFSFLELDPVPVDCSTQNRGTYSDPIDPASEDRLRKYFRPFNQRTYDLVGRDFGWDS